jgi:hypothetical protein
MIGVGDRVDGARLYQMLFVTLGFIPQHRNCTVRAASLPHSSSMEADPSRKILLLNTHLFAFL